MMLIVDIEGVGRFRGESGARNMQMKIDDEHTQVLVWEGRVCHRVIELINTRGKCAKIVIAFERFFMLSSVVFWSSIKHIVLWNIFSLAKLLEGSTC